MAEFRVDHNYKKITNLQTLLNCVRELRDSSPTGAVWLRGLSNSNYRLLPSIGREYCFAGKKKKFTSDIEQRFLHRFRRHAFAFFGRELTEWEALLVARHHGLPVRLLDWTSNPLAALFFACEYTSAGMPSDAIIWALIPSKKILEYYLDVFDNKIRPFDVKGIKLVYPMEVATRINAQSGHFTIQHDPWTPMDEIVVSDLQDCDVDIQSLKEYIIPARYRGDILKELNDLQVTRRTLFPDLDGLSSGLITAEILRG